MIEWEVGDGHLRVVDADNAEVTVEGRGLAVAGPGPAISRPVDETVEATASRLRLPHAIVYAFSLGRDEQYELDPSGEPLSLPSGEYIVDIDTEIKIYLRFSGRAIIEQADDYEHIDLAFPDRRRVIFGFRSHHELPAGTITVPSTPEGTATAITHLTSSQKTSTPDRTYPTLRGHPPLVRQGPESEIPDRIEASTPDTGIELLVPDAYEPLFVTAPLAYYLQARVRTTERETPTLRLPDVAREVSLSSMPTLEREVEQLLRKTFFLDCLVRNAGPYRANLSELSMLEALELDMDTLYEATPQRRLATYLNVPYSAIEHRLPTWHLTTYVEPTPSNVELLPFLLDRLSLLGLPRTSELEGKELVERSLEDFYRGPGSDPNARAGTSQVASVDIVKPELKSSHAHGWLADGVPIDVFKSAPEAYYNRLNYLENGNDTTSICIVLNDPEMDGEQTDVADIYRQRSDDLAIDVTVEESLGTAELARVFETDHDFVHYIGHCETEGLRCSDGSLSIDCLDRCNAQTFFLNACGSFYEGLSLIEKGSVAGAVTFTKVLNDHAVKVGSTFAKLLIHGFSIERAMSLARRRIMMGKDYAVVGDGTHSLTQGEHRVPTTGTVEHLEDDQYLLSLECFSTQMTGLYYYPHVETNEHAYLCGTESSFTLETAELVSFLKESETPVIYDGDVYWSQDLWPLVES
ncbi:hypothetical protein [Natronoglomus mannanivorans]|uniref:CHAT domain-containing protein n=1 Tax=Natronoglomus mannanivorans TaxID=2979990 RepID=A0AAP3E0G1_9EURY|nr:hypothetical protein [Halobacteria archaeon AArc-xg1-1]